MLSVNSDEHQSEEKEHNLHFDCLKGQQKEDYGGNIRNLEVFCFLIKKSKKCDEYTLPLLKIYPKPTYV